MAKKLANTKTQESGFAQAFQIITSIYLLLILAVLPLFTPDAYYSIGDNKWWFWIIVTSIYVVLMLVIYIAGFFAGRGWREALGISNRQYIIDKLKDFSITDKFVFAYLLIVLLSAICSPYKFGMWIGAEGWNMGLWSQLGFVFSYFIITRSWKYSNGIMRWVLVASGLVYLYAILMRFDIDPLGFYDGLTDVEKFNYISTIGQTSWYSSYLCLALPLAIIVYWGAKKNSSRIFATIIVILGFMSTVTQNSDSAYLAFAAYMFVLFWISIKDNLGFRRFLELLIMCLASFKFIGVMQIAFADRATELDAISMEISKGKLTWLALAAVIAVYIAFRLLDSRVSGFDVSKIAWIRWVLLVLVAATIISVTIYIILNTTGSLTGHLTSDNNYLNFDNAWGNNRGITWKSAAGTFVNENFLYKLIGTGPDTFYESVYTFYEEAINDYFISTTGEYYVVLCAHNEWLNILIVEGIIGLIAYLGTFIASFSRCMKYGKEHFELYGIAMAIAAYFAHNFFCYQQAVCTSFIFGIMGCAEALIRWGHVELDTIESTYAREGKKPTLKDLFKEFMNA